MRKKKYSCPNGCTLPPRKKVLTKVKDSVYKFGYKDFNYCPVCGGFMPESLNKIKGFFDVYKIHPSLERACKLIYKSEFAAAAREAFVAVETVLRDKSGLDAHGFDLATKALSFEFDKKTEELKKPPLIAINDLKTESDRNEQDGIRYMLMGFFQGPRNLYQHKHIESSVDNTISIIIEASFFLRLLDGHSMVKKGKWILSEVDWKDIYDNMSNPIDRARLVYRLKKRNRRLKRKTNRNEN